MPLVRILCFFLVLFLLAGTAQYYLQYRERYNDNSSFQIINFYKEEKNSADAVFVGSSCTFAFYSPLFAYENYGIKTINYSSSGMGMLAYRYAIEEVRKTQKDAMILLTVTPNYEMQYLGVHFMSDYMPFSKNKIDFLLKYFTQPGESVLNSVGFFVPIVEYHDRWAEMDKDDFIIDEGIKGATRHQYYLGTVNDISEAYYRSDEKMELPEKMEVLMKDLLDYLDENDENIIFIFPPKTYKEDEYKQMSELYDLITSRGYEVLDLRDSFEDLSLSMKQDFYDINHTNIHGSIKYTDHLAQYVMKQRNCTVTDDSKWNAALEKYHEIISTHVLDVETDMKNRDYDLQFPVLSSIKQENDTVTVNWSEIPGANGYIVYRNEGNGFERVFETDTNLFFSDKDVEEGKTYTYTVLSYREDNGRRLYGNYDYKGLTIEVK